MGEASDIVGKPKDEHKAPRKTKKALSDVHVPGTRAAKAGVVAVLTDVIDDLDRAIQVKQNDLSVEGHGMVPENHYKLGILKGADSLMRRARAMLQDYGLDLDEIGHTEDPQAAKGEEIEAHSDMANAAEECSDCGKPMGECFCDEAEDADEDGPRMDDAEPEDDKGGKC